MIQLIIIYLIVAYLASWWPFKEQIWQGYVYPNSNNLLIDKYVGAYKTLEECRAASVAMLDNLNSREKGDYECGLNCKPKDGLNICDKTER
ncbi:hypothetical protein ABXJ76_16365 [Methylobacter sp. G7]|uniref:hypothetical protein n=1 Tax=Methylobacter sp. G7 TaxID=3230117 RepID=UPI003D806187